MNYKLTISVITMNRAAQLKEALESCFSCKLPVQTQFVIIDNASTDNTEQIVTEVLENCGYDYYYEKLPENLGVGGGRNYAFSKANGEYVYVLDDDAVIDAQKNPDFFTRAIALLEKQPDIVTLTTQIYDTVWKKNRVEKSGRAIAQGVYLCKMFCGGSHFLRKAFFADVPYLPNKYGYEEIPPSLRVMDTGMYNAFCADLLVIHKPAVNKWDWSEGKNTALLINGIAAPYVIQRMMFPRICALLLWMAMQIRFHRSLRSIPNARKRFRAEVKNISSQYKIADRIKLSTVWRMFKEFGLSAF